LALAMGDVTDGYDVLGIWARFFLCITFAIWLGVTTHDLALIGRAQKNFILDVTGVNEHCPSIRRVWRVLAGYRLLGRLVTRERLGWRVVGIALAAILAPILLVWNVVVFNFVICPVLLLTFLRYPIRMSRAWVFIVCLACSLYGLTLTIQQTAFVFNPHFRPRYAVTWIHELTDEDRKAGITDPCTCGCDYPVSFSVCVNLLVIGLVTTFKSIILALRCLKGLRRCQWANLLSVLFPVPITVYSVDWKQPNGMPIRYRTEDMPVQGEVAFDPFAMMDEQLDSAFTTVHLKPSPVHRYEYDQAGELNLVPSWRKLETPAMPLPSSFCANELQLRKVEYIGGCGFPWPTGGTQCVYDPAFMEHLERGPVAARRRAAADEDGPAASSQRRPTGATLLSRSAIFARDFGSTESLASLSTDTVASDTITVDIPHASGQMGVVLSVAPLPDQPADHPPLVWEDDGEEGRGQAADCTDEETDADL